MIHFLCSSCKRALKAKDDDAGKKCKCKCGEVNEIPGGEVEEEPSDEIEVVDTQKEPLPAVTHSVVFPPPKVKKDESSIYSITKQQDDPTKSKRVGYARRSKFFSEFVAVLTIICTVVGSWFIIETSRGTSQDIGYAVGGMIGSCFFVLLMTTAVSLLADISSAMNSRKKS